MELCMFMQYAEDTGGTDTSCKLDKGSKAS